MLEKCYKKAPIDYFEGIPVFSRDNAYTENYAEIANDHLSVYSHTGDNPFIAKAHWLEIEDSTRKIIDKYATPGMRLLDIGVGIGQLFGLLENGLKYGMDISIGYLKKAREKEINVCMSLIDDMPYKDEYFDICVTTDVLEHVFDLNDSLVKILTVLKKGGLLIIRVPYKENLSFYRSDQCPYDFVHLRNFDEDSLILLLEKVFELEVLEYSFTGYSNAPLLFGNNLKFYGAIMRRLLRFLSKISKTLYRFFAVRMLKPVEINMVVRKP